MFFLVQFFKNSLYANQISLTDDIEAMDDGGARRGERKRKAEGDRMVVVPAKEKYC